MKEYWYKEAIIYELHVKCFYDCSGDGCGDFKGLTQKLDYLQELGITAIWLLPFYPSPLKDDGYDISDYTDVHPQYGELKDFKEFLHQAHSRGLKVITELVINHTSDQHPWFQRARKAEKGSSERDFYVWSEDQEKYKEARIIFQDFEASNWTWDRELQSYYWHRFYSHQPDLNFENPEVHKALFQKMSFWLKMGVDGMRLDAIPYLYEQEGTNCENLLQTHEFLKKLRTHVDENFKDRMLLAEANQWPEDAAKYFGEGDECQMAFHFPVMPRLFMAIHLEDSLPIVEIMGQTPQIPENCQWALFLRNHDELTLEMVTDEERDYMFRVYAYDPQARVNLGIRRRLAPLLKNDRRKIELMNVLLFSLNGTPVLYYGDELGMGDNIYLGDRNGVRTPMQWSNDRNAGFSRANPQQLYLPPIIDPEYHYETVNVEAQLNNPYSLLWWTKQLIALRKRFKAFSYGTTQFLQVENRKVLVFFREYEDELILIITNLSRFAQYVELDLQQYNGYRVVEMFSGEKFPFIGELPYFLTLGPYGYYWFSLEKQPEKSLFEQIDLRREKQVVEVVFKGETEKIFHPQFRSLLESTVKKYLYKRSWFRPFLTSLDRTKICISDHLVLTKTNEHKMHVLFVEIVLTTGVVHHIPLFLAHYEGEIAKEKLDFSPETIVAKIVRGKSSSVIVDIGVQLKSAGVIADIGMDPDLSKELMQMIQEQKKIKGENGELKGKKLPSIHEDLDRFPSIEPGWVSRREGVIITPLQDGVLKVFSRIEEGMHLDVEMRLFLSKQTEFKAYLPLLGYIEYTSPDKTSLAVAEEVVSHRTEYNAKFLSTEAAHRFLVRIEAMQEPLDEEVLLPQRTLMSLAYGKLDPELRRLLEDHPEVMHLLGETTADFHRVMYSNREDSSFSPLKYTLFYQRSMYQNIRRKIGLAYARLKSLYPHLDESSQKKVNILFSHHEQILKKLHILPHRKFNIERTRYHGNFVLENLHYTGKEFLIANFEGNPNYSYSERRYKRSPLLDVASMLFSITEASFEAVERLESRGLMSLGDLDQMHKYAHVWALWTGSSFLRAYLFKAKKNQILPSNQKEIDFLLGIFLLERSMEHLADPKKKKINPAIWTLLHWLPIYETFELS